MRWFPLYVTSISATKDVRLLFVVEYESIVFVGQAFGVLADHEVSHVELGTCQSEEIFDAHFNQRRPHSKHLIASHKVSCAF